MCGATRGAGAEPDGAPLRAVTAPGVGPPTTVWGLGVCSERKGGRVVMMGVRLGVACPSLCPGVASGGTRGADPGQHVSHRLPGTHMVSLWGTMDPTSPASHTGVPTPWALTGSGGPGQAEATQPGRSPAQPSPGGAHRDPAHTAPRVPWRWPWPGVHCPVRCPCSLDTVPAPPPAQCSRQPRPLRVTSPPVTAWHVGAFLGEPRFRSRCMNVRGTWGSLSYGGMSSLPPTRCCSLGCSSCGKSEQVLG